MSEVGIEIVKTEETEESKIKYLNINVSNDEVDRNPDIVRLCADAGILEYVKSKTGHWIPLSDDGDYYKCSECGKICYPRFCYCPICGAKMKSGK